MRANALVLLGARYLDPLTGSFVSVDPLLDPLRPAHFNAYSYGWNNPVTWDDPSGLAPTVQFDGGVAGKYRPKVGAAGSSTRASSGQYSISGVTVPAHTAMGGCGMSYNPCGAKPLTPEQREAAKAWLQGTLTVVGLAPVVGEVADGLSELICLGDGDMACAGLSAASMVPFLGWGAAGAKFGKVDSDLAESSVAPARAAPPIQPGSSGGVTAGAPFSQSVRQQALNENASTCVCCRMTTDRPQVDHAIPRSRGGVATLDNAQTTCGHCNASKGARDYPLSPPAGFEGRWPPLHWADPR